MRGCARPRGPPWRESLSRRSCRRCSPSFRTSCGLVSGAWYLKEGAVLQPQRGHLAAPDAAAVERCKLLVELEAERRPVAADDRLAIVPELEPWRVAGRRSEERRV